jgi:hypothetical protein
LVSLVLAAAPDAAVTVEPADKHCGVSWVAARKITPENLKPLVDSHVNWIVQAPFGWQRGLDNPVVTLATSGRILWGETDEGLRVTTRAARAGGIKTLLKPHVWITGGGWRGEIEMADDAAWADWFESYRAFILHYARFAQASGIEALCIGTELQTSVRFEDDWRLIIREIRAVYDGKLTYAANWYREYEQVPFWDAVDYIGVQAYFPLAEGADTSVETLTAGWRRPLKKIAALSAEHGKPVLFTEIGYRSVPYAAKTPWEWPRRGEEVEPDPQLQARCYEAFYRTVWDEPWFAGVYWWKWFPTHTRAGGDGHVGFTPQNKPAQGIMSEWFKRTQSTN